MLEGVIELDGKRNSALPQLPYREGFFPIWQTFVWNSFLLRSRWASKGFFAHSGSLSEPAVAAFFELRSIGFGQF